MPYEITLTDGSVLLELPDGLINTAACSLALVGRSAPNYGGAIANDLVQMLENFSNVAAPAAPLEGQLWWDKTDQVLRVLVADGSWALVGLGGKVSGNDGAVSQVSIAVEGDQLGFININPNAPANSTRFRTVVLDSGSWALQALNDDGSLKATPLVVDATGQLTTFAPVAGEAATAARLATAVTISLTGAAAGSVNFDGSEPVAIPVTLAPSGVAAGTYLSVVVGADGRVTSGGGLSLGDIKLVGDVTGEGTNTIQTYLSQTGVAVGANGTGTYSVVVVDASGRVTSGAALTVSGDVSGQAVGDGLALSLSPVPGLVPGTYSAVVVNAAGRVTGGSSAAGATAAAALGFTPVNAAGGTMTGTLTISDSAGNSVLDVDAPDLAQPCVVRASTGGVPRWDFGANGAAETGSDTGSDFELLSYADTGVPLLTALSVSRATGAITIAGALTVNGGISGNASTASRLSAIRTLSVSGDASGSATFDGSTNIALPISLAVQGAITPGVTYSSVVLNAKGVVTAAAAAPTPPPAGGIGAYALYGSSSSLATGISVAAATVGQTVGTWTVMSCISFSGAYLSLVVRTA